MHPGQLIFTISIAAELWVTDLPSFSRRQRRQWNHPERSAHLRGRGRRDRRFRRFQLCSQAEPQHEDGVHLRGIPVRPPGDVWSRSRPVSAHPAFQGGLSMKRALPLLAALAGCSLREPRVRRRRARAPDSASHADVCFLGECRPPAANLSLVGVEVRPPSSSQYAVKRQQIDGAPERPERLHTLSVPFHRRRRRPPGAERRGSRSRPRRDRDLPRGTPRSSATASSRSPRLRTRPESTARESRKGPGTSSCRFRRRFPRCASGCSSPAHRWSISSSPRHRSSPSSTEGSPPTTAAPRSGSEA